MNEITSRKNPVAKAAASLASSGERRKELSAYLVEGARLTADAARSGVLIKRLFYTAEAWGRYREYLEEALSKAEESYLIAPPVAELLSTTKNSQGVFAWCSMGNALQEQHPQGKLLLLENIQDPSNLGAVLRTAEALGIRHVVFSGECCDRFSPKCLRASMGAVFRAAVHSFPEAGAACAFLKESGYRVYGAVPAREAVKITEADFTGNTAVAIGNEGNGLSGEMKALCDGLVTIPMGGRAESLNAATAAAIIMWEMTK